jgi:sensor histidine kinase YesM
MHPIFARRERLSIYLVAWIPLAAMLAVLLAAASPLNALEAASLAVPLAVVYAFQTLASYYVCRSAPPLETAFPRFVATHGTAALVSSFLWVLGAFTLVSFLPEAGGVTSMTERFAPAVPTLFLFGVLVYVLVTALHAVLHLFERGQDAERRRLASVLLAREAELKALRAQLDPHFLFNSLNSVAALTTTEPAKARQMCVLFSDFLRRSLGASERADLPLGEELSLARDYLEIERVRFGHRLAIEERVEEGSLDARVPPLLLQPLVENAVTHGVATLLEGGTVSVEAARLGSSLVLTIANPFDADAGQARGAGVGLENVRKRLAAAYGERAALLTESAGGLFRVRVTLPQ